MSIDSTHPEYDFYINEWNKIRDICDSRRVDRFLIPLNEHDRSEVMEARRKAYRDRAVFYAIAGQTVNGLLGTLFRKWPSLSVPVSLEYVGENCDGEGNSIYQQSQGLAHDVLRYSRAGLYVSHPPTEGVVTKEQVMNLEKVATINRVSPQSIVNWNTRSYGSRLKLSLVVIREAEMQLKHDSYDHEVVEKVRELYLDENDIYKEKVWEKRGGNWKLLSEVTPTDAQGNVWNEIPFAFVGSENNDHRVDDPFLLPLVNQNIAHYRNSADWEDSVFYAGQPQPWMSGITQSHVDFMQDNNMYFGSREVIGVPEGGSMGIAQATPNPVVRQAMLDKLDMMIAMGARLIAPSTVAKTATQVEGEREAQHSVLSLTAANISEAYNRALEWTARYMGVEMAEDEGYEINRDFVRPNVDVNELKEVIAGYLQGVIPANDYIHYMKQRELFNAEKPNDDYMDELTELNYGNNTPTAY